MRSLQIFYRPLADFKILSDLAGILTFHGQQQNLPLAWSQDFYEIGDTIKVVRLILRIRTRFALSLRETYGYD